MRRPPQTSTEALKTLKEVDARYEVGAKFLSGTPFFNIKKPLTNAEIQDKKKELLSNVPPGVSVSRLVYPIDKKNLATVLLIGVKRRTIIHASYVHDFLETVQPNVVFVQQSPDQPLFIKTKSTISVQQRWFSFLKAAKETRFYVSSKPAFTSDILLNKEKLKNLMEQNIIPSTDFDLSTQVLYSRQKSILDYDLKPDALMTPLLWAYNANVNSNV